MTIARDFKLNTSGDLDMTGGDINFVDDTLAIIQLVSNRLQFWQGEWFLDQRQGMPYFGQIFVKNPNLAIITGLFRNAIAGTPGIVRVISCTLAFNSSTRKLAVTWSAQATTSQSPIGQTDNLFFPASVVAPAVAP